jgi:Escherichia/Staphylococcus phage prohead protease
MSDETVIRREFPAVLEPTGDGRTLDLRIVPYKTKARVSDGGEPYYEEWLPGVFDKQLNAANRVLVNVEHEKSFGGVVGRGAELRETPDGFEGSFRVLKGSDGDKALELVNDGVLTGVSLEAIPVKSERTADGVVQRVKARLINIALCRFPAFEQAQVLAVREQPNVTLNFEGSKMTSAELVDAVRQDFTRDAVIAPEPEPDPAPEPDPEPPKPEPPAMRSEADELLERLGYEPLPTCEVIRKDWNKEPSRFEDDEWRSSCLLDRGDQFDTPKSRYVLPVLEPNGDLNVNAMHAAAVVLAGGRGGVSASAQAKAAAARKLRRYYGMAGEESPPALMAMASR